MLATLVSSPCMSTGGGSLCGEMSYGTGVTFPSPSDVQSHTIGAVLSMIRTLLFGAILNASMLDFPFAWSTC